ncbi:MAG: DNA-deoxyinosine glycosylase [Eggerthellaceae bacterium]|nr:DNA-deoxyinosine glycosylase [Eggerthellaceae bacterium]
MTSTHVIHEIEPVYDKNSRVLLLGTMPSPKSRETGFFYGHPQNRFWKVLALLFDEPTPETIKEKRDLCLRHHIALWDVVSSCDIEGASDASIKNAKPNDLAQILNVAPIQAVFTTGTKAGQLYKKLCEPATSIPCTVLPSTSPANSRVSLAELCTTYKQALSPYLDFNPEYPVLDVPEVVRLEQSIASSGTSLYTLMHRAGRFLAYEAKKYLEQKYDCRESDRNIAKPKEAECSEINHNEPERSKTASGQNQFLTIKPNQLHVSILCGHGNNGGDGWVAADYLAKAGYHVDLISSVSAQEIKAEPAHTTACEIEHEIKCEIEHEAEYRVERETECKIEYKVEHEAKHETKQEIEHKSKYKAGRKIAASPKSKQTIHLLINPTNEEVEASLSKADLIIDAILGTGFSGDTVREPFSTWIELANQQKVREEVHEKLHNTDHRTCSIQNARIIAADVASGFSAQIGTAATPCIVADHTVTMITLKTGLVQPNAKTYCGTIRVAPLALFDL